MSTITRINQEVKTLPDSLQQKVLAYVELLKYQSSIEKAEKLTQELGGMGQAADDDVLVLLSTMGDVPGGDWTVEELHEKIEVVERVNEALNRMKNGEPGIPNREMRKKAQQWRSR
ncbi:MAG: DUF2281 domain-containing protein [Lewinellaceae bacterium]|nr:DUF2281 domain-containing protein [Lewinellaceae bacterium]